MEVERKKRWRGTFCAYKYCILFSFCPTHSRLTMVCWEEGIMLRLLRTPMVSGTTTMTARVG